MRQLFLGVDGGGTKCRMRLADDNLKTLGEIVTQNPANLQLRDGDIAYETIIESAPQVFAKANVDFAMAANTYACFGMAGARLKSARQAFATRDYPFASVQVFDDVDIARTGAHGGEDGAVLIIGTGSAGLGLVNGERLQIGGWGFLVGDDMSGAILGRDLLRRSLAAHEGVEKGSRLTEAVMQHFNNDPGKLMSWSFVNEDAIADAERLHIDAGKMSTGSETDLGQECADNWLTATNNSTHARPTDYGQFVPMLLDYFEKDDAIAKELMQIQLRSVDNYVNWFVARGAKSIAVVGGLGRRLQPIIKSRYGDLIVEPKSGPLQGALILARQEFQNNMN